MVCIRSAVSDQRKPVRVADGSVSYERATALRRTGRRLSGAAWAAAALTFLGPVCAMLGHVAGVGAARWFLLLAPALCAAHIYGAVLTASVVRGAGRSLVMCGAGVCAALIPGVGCIAMFIAAQLADDLLQGGHSRGRLWNLSDEDLIKFGNAACPHCDYDLRGLRVGICPECGGLLPRTNGPSNA